MTDCSCLSRHTGGPGATVGTPAAQNMLPATIILKAGPQAEQLLYARLQVAARISAEAHVLDALTLYK